ncbi:hypothetical protein [Thalassomonas haliotis]|uniref:Uncharacterized protein n=1 Tax=Thalassomonas haliotis TaxID=485448 RepID=A0ABY7VLJ9_9GAMM|nr:hypothetical protein [Thalassomonas haliotis]WDE13946.1 hypothetical protein H3N35_11160 [Thalassomonas haliotis]
MSESNLPLTEDAVEREPLSSDFVNLNDDFSKFSEECAFSFDALAAVSRESECITPHTSEGSRHLCYWLKYQVIGYREKIDEMQDSWRVLNRRQ